MVLVLLIFFILYQLIISFMSLCLHLTYYPLVVSPISLIVLFLLPKIIFVYMTGVWDRRLALDVSVMVFITYDLLQMLARL